MDMDNEEACGNGQGKDTKKNNKAPVNHALAAVHLTSRWIQTEKQLGPCVSSGTRLTGNVL